jgi:hypothetical protein
MTVTVKATQGALQPPEPRTSPRRIDMRLGTEYIDSTISRGTLNPDHLIAAFADFIEDHSFLLDPENGGAGGFEEELRKWLRDDEAADDEDATILLECCFDLLDDIAPEGTYFGAHEGDGADFGFWTYEEDSYED